VNWITDETDTRVQTALGWTCDVCNARVKNLCTNPMQPSAELPGRVVHFARLIDRKRHG